MADNEDLTHDGTIEGWAETICSLLSSYKDGTAISLVSSYNDIRAKGSTIRWECRSCGKYRQQEKREFKTAEYYVGKYLKEAQEHYVKMVDTSSVLELARAYHDTVEALELANFWFYRHKSYDEAETEFETEFLVGIRREIDKGLRDTAEFLECLLRSEYDESI